MNQTYIKKRSKILERLELFTYDEYEPLTNKRCKEKATGKFYSYEEMSRILKLSVTQIKRVIVEYIKIKTPEDQDKFILHGNIKQQYSKKYGDDYDQTLLGYYQEFCNKLTDDQGLIAPFTLIEFITYLRDEKKFAYGSYSTVRKRLLAHDIVSLYANKRTKKSLKKKIKSNDKTSKSAEQILNLKHQ